MTNKLKKKTLHFIESFLNNKNKDIDKLYKSFFSKNVKVSTPIENSVGIKCVQKIHKMWLHAFPDMVLKINKINSFDSLVMVHWVCKATHLREFNGISPEGKVLDYEGITCFYFSNSKVSEYRCIVDMMLVYQQLGFYLKRQEYDEQGIICNDYVKISKKIMNFEHKNGNLSRREVEVLSLWICGFSAKGIALILSIHYRTVQTIISNISYKCNCISKSGLKDYITSIELLCILKDLAIILLNLNNKSMLRSKTNLG